MSRVQTRIIRPETSRLSAAMASAAYRSILFAASLLAPAWAQTGDAPVRATPSRPASGAPDVAKSAASVASLPARKIAGVDYISVGDAAAQLGLKAAWLERGRRLTLTGQAVRAELENDTRDITVNGTRVFLGDPILDASGQLYVSRIDFERCLTPLLRPGYGTHAQPALKTIVLDPGHGGKDNGTSVNEKTFALDVAKRAKRILETAGYRVILTRESDTFLELPERSAIANANRAGLFVSIHFNAVAKDSRTSGVEVFTFAPRFQRSTNAWSLGSSTDVEKEAAAVNRFDHWSSVLAHSIHRHFVTDLKSFDRGKKIAHWGVLRQLNCPGVLIECGFLTSDVEARKIATTAHRQKLAEAIASGIRDYASYGDGTRPRASAASNKPRHSPAPARRSRQ